MNTSSDDSANQFSGLAYWFRHFGQHEVQRSPLYQRICAIVADSPELLSLVLHATPMQRRPNLFLAACHASLLRDSSHDLARWHASVAEQATIANPDEPALATALQDFCTTRRTELVELITNGATQTNEVGRSALLLPALHVVAQSVGDTALALVEVGASAGLNLRLDRYGFAYTGREVLQPEAALVLQCDTDRSEEALPDDLKVPAIEFRTGLDLNPLDLDKDVDVRWLLALIWPDEIVRFQRMKDAIAAGRSVPVTLHQADAIDGLAALVASVSPNLHPVVLTTWVLAYLEPERRTAFVAEMERLGNERDLSWIAIEHPTYAPELLWPQGITGSAASLGNPLLLHSWRNGSRTSQWLATAHGHGHWLNWHPQRLSSF